MEDNKQKKKKKKKLRKSQKYTIIFFAFMLAIFLIQQINIRYNQSPITMHPETEKYEVVFRYIHDGDTAVFMDKNTKEDIICRFLAVDSPEIDEEGYEEAKEYTKNCLSNARNIVLELDPYSDKYDKYQRLLAWVWIDGQLLQAKLLENDLANIRYVYNDYLYTAYLNKIVKQNVTE